MGKNINIKLTFHFKYYEIAYHNYLKAKESFEESADSGKWNIRQSRETNRQLIVTVIFSALTLETYINHYGIHNFSKSYFNNYLDKLSTISKWIIIPRLVTGAQINTDSQAFENLKWLFSLRNDLVHFKPKKVKWKNLLSEYPIKDVDAKKSIKTVRLILEELNKIDNKTNTNWLDIIKDDIEQLR